MKEKISDPLLLTPGPLTTSEKTKEAMLHDWGSRDKKFININKTIRKRLLNIAGVSETHECVPMQGSGTFVVEATLGTLLKRNSKALIIINGAYGIRMTHMLDKMNRNYITYETAENEPPNPSEIDKILSNDKTIDFVTIVHCETTSGILNPIELIAKIVSSHKRKLIIDAMSAFGAIAIDPNQVIYDAIVFSANKCFEGVPGLGFSIIRRSLLEGSSGNTHSLSLDLHDQWKALENNGQYRFTPPTQVICAFKEALDQFESEGGISERNKRYRNNCKVLINGLKNIGFRTLLSEELQAPIIVSVHMPSHPNFKFQKFYDAMEKKGFILYPGKLTIAETFRIGCIGALNENDMNEALDAIRLSLKEISVNGSIYDS